MVSYVKHLQIHFSNFDMTYPLLSPSVSLCFWLLIIYYLSDSLILSLTLHDFFSSFYYLSEYPLALLE